MDGSRSGGGDGEVSKTLTMNEDDGQALPFIVKLNEFRRFFLASTFLEEFQRVVLTGLTRFVW